MSVNYGVSNEIRNLTTTGRTTIPLGILSQTPVQRKGSLIFDPMTLKLYYSDGAQWLEISASSGDLVCIQDADGDTSVCTDTIPETDSDTIFFTTSGIERMRITPAGVLSVGSTTPTAGKIAHFEGDIKVTGIIDPTGTQYEEQPVVPVDPTGSTTGVVWVRDDNPNSLIFTNNTGANTVLTGGGAVTDLAGTLVVGNFTGGNDIVLTTGDEIVGLTDVVISGADNTGGIGGDVNINAGNDSTTGTGGNVNITGGNSVAGIPGDVNISSTGDISLTAPPTRSVNVGDISNFSSTTVQTTDDTPTLLESISLAIPDRIYSILGRVVARSNNIGASFLASATFHRDGGTTVRQLGPTIRTEHKDDPDWRINLVVASSAVDVFVIGVNFVTIDWKISTALYISD